MGILDLAIFIFIIQLVIKAVKRKQESQTGGYASTAGQKTGRSQFMQGDADRKERESLRKSRRKEASAKPNRPRQASAKPNQPRTDKGFGDVFHPGRKKEKEALGRKTVPVQEKAQDIMQKVNQHIYGTDADQADLLLYKNYLEVQRCTDIKKMAREMECTMYQVIREIRDFQEMGYFGNVTIDDDNYVLHYTDRSPGGSMRGFASAYTEASPRVASGQREACRKSGFQRSKAADASVPCASASSKEAAKADQPFHAVTYMTMPEQGPSIGYMTMTGDYKSDYMTMTQDYTVGYMTMPEQGMEIHYNTMPEGVSEEA